MYLSELKEYIELHERLGSNNPLFLYDPESYCWFIDFSKVGRHKKELSLKYVLATTAEILASFNLYKYYPDLQGYPLYQKFHDAILEFYSKRSRPADKRILSPTLIKCGTIFSTEAKVTLEDTRGFSAQNLIPMDKFK
jgi:hypothetical protein